MAYDEVTPQQLRQRLAAGEDVFVLDVREHDEVAQWSFAGATHIPLGELGQRSGELPGDRQIVVLCAAGVRSAAAAEALDRGGWQAANLVGGVMAWQQSAPEG